jgi:tetratricopeptide (TPR) repeat protein
VQGLLKTLKRGPAGRIYRTALSDDLRLLMRQKLGLRTDSLDTVKTINLKLRAFETEETWEEVPKYLDRLPVERQEQPTYQMWRAIALYKSGSRDQGLKAIHQALIAPNSFHVANTRGFLVLQKQLDIRSVLENALQAVKSGTAGRDEIMFVCWILYQYWRLDELDELMVSVADRFTQDPEFGLLYAQVLFSTHRKDQAVSKALDNYQLAPDSIRHALMVMRFAWSHSLDAWIEPALSIGENMLAANEVAEYEGPLVQGIARLCNRLVDKEHAVERMERVVARGLHDPSAVVVVAGVFFDKGQSARAYEYLHEGLDIHPSSSEIIFQVVGILAGESREDEAIALLETHVNKKVEDVEYFALIGHIYANSGRSKFAVRALRKALQIDPNHASALADMAMCAEMEGDYTVALSFMERASTSISVVPIKQIKGLNLMHQSRIRRRMMFVADLAGQETTSRALQREAIHRTPLHLPYRFSEWQSGSLDGKSVVALSTLGVGDEIRYTCVYPRLLSGVKDIWLTCDPRLEGLMTRSFPKFNIMPVTREFPGIKARRLDERTLAQSIATRKIVSDEVVEIGRSVDMFLRPINLFEADAFGNHLLHQSPQEPVLIPDPTRVQKFKAHLEEKANGRKVIGLSWRGGRMTYSRNVHYFDIKQWLPILENSDACFVNLQYAIEEEELDWLREVLGNRFIEFPDLDLFDDMEGIAALCSQLDLSIAICTSVLELGCAVGTPTLYLMRSPQATHTIRLNNDLDRFGTQQDSVWSSCRILPRINMDDKTLIDVATEYVQNI